MHDSQLNRSIQSIGQECFVKYFKDFSNQSLSNEYLIELLMKNEGYKESGCRTRITQSRRIINSGRAKDALLKITKSKRLPKSVVSHAKSLYFNESPLNEVKDLWLKFNEYSNKLAIALGRTSNIVGEYAEYLAHKYYGGSLLKISEASADMETKDGVCYQIKARKIKGTPSTQLSVIRSWDFDFLVVILFNANGTIRQALEVPVEIAKEYGKSNNHQNGWVITTSENFLNDKRAKDISLFLSELNEE